MINKFNKIAIAVAFSQRLEANIFEASRFATLFNAELLLIHVGEETVEKKETFLNYISKTGFDVSKTNIVWKQGKPANSIAESCNENKVDLLIAGALIDESLYEYHIGSVARKLSRMISCSLLLLTNPSVKPKNCQRIVVNGLENPKTDFSIKMAVLTANKVQAKELIIVDEVCPKKAKLKIDFLDNKAVIKAEDKRKNIRLQEDQRISDILKDVEVNPSIKITNQCVFGQVGYSIGHFSQTIQSDLLIVNSPDKRMGFLDRIFTNNLEYILSDLPCDLMIVNPK